VRSPWEALRPALKSKTRYIYPHNAPFPPELKGKARQLALAVHRRKAGFGTQRALCKLLWLKEDPDAAATRLKLRVLINRANTILGKYDPAERHLQSRRQEVFFS
jgi:hypothetical protein